ncbi:MAG: HAD family phosphatase [Tannerellaceae bacterium]|jgi:putative hydrolase of the HAD superfamily|nr:HAD family phosphatase [Tannerellaceae bacterium]
MKEIKNLVIDFGGVIINLARNRCIEAFAALGIDVREQLNNNYLHKDMFMAIELGQMTAAEFRDAIRLLTSRKVTNKQIDDAWICMINDVPAYKLDLLLELKKKYNTLLLSNTNEFHWSWSEKNVFSYKGYQAADFFNKIYLSYKLHMVKPHAGIFEYVIKDAGIIPQESLFIDDALPNCRTAESLGFRTYMPGAGEDWRHLFSPL